jgi:hypothetical protein
MPGGSGEVETVVAPMPGGSGEVEIFYSEII